MQNSLYSSTYSTLKRITEIHRRLLPPGELPTTKSLVKEFGVSRKTVQRDIKFMKETWELPIRYNASKAGYEYEQEVVDFPGIKVTEEEVFAFLVARNSLDRYKGTAVREPLARIFEKFILQMGIITSRMMERMNEYVSFRPAGWNTMDYSVLDTLSKACRDRRLVSFDYVAPQRGKERKEKLRPLQLVNHANAWYMFAWDEKKNMYPLYSLARVSNQRIHSSTFPEHEFSLDKYMKDSFGIFRGDRTYKVRVWFDDFAAPYIRERKWNDSQKIKDLKDGEIEFSITVNDLIEIKGWILNWGEYAKVLSPKELVDDMKGELEKTLAHYTD
jgi:predicted DNA-binding transcriptional regulator YafY